MTHNHEEVRRHHWLIRYYRAQLRFELRVLTALRIIPAPIAAAVFAWLRRTEIPKRGTDVNQSIRSKIVIPIVILLAVTALALALVARWQVSPEQPSGMPGSAGTPVPGEVEDTAARLEAWKRPTTTDAKEFAIAYARAIWTYDTTRHSFYDWEDAVSVYADPTGAAPRVAKSLLPRWSEWKQLELHKAHASVDGITAETTPELEAMAREPGARKGWRGFVIRGKQTTVLDNETTVTERQAAVGIVCASICKFWSATAQVSP
ncbi:hypothetical protein EV643_103269 [Kribbella sp. VKM Ac-2527]|uniref:Uncharacterized protein n=1 Tax=Kribbella caucasensis TaxID=2512215 RepID=A0A4R6KN63_9ACTN|nr:hypothetical protein [Kribbella sp. VKM Ac-2527]TDO51530.1 hypothetical protein EV643_103269 [Kribbella sp. VKM Ac-2527]